MGVVTHALAIPAKEPQIINCGDVMTFGSFLPIASLSLRIPFFVASFTQNLRAVQIPAPIKGAVVPL